MTHINLTIIVHYFVQSKCYTSATLYNTRGTYILEEKKLKIEQTNQKYNVFFKVSNTYRFELLIIMPTTIDRSL